MDKTKVKILPKPLPQHLGPMSGVSSPVPLMPAPNKRKLSSAVPQPLTPMLALLPQSLPKRTRKALNPPPVPPPTQQQLDDKAAKASGHRPVTLCTFCRQHKIKCNALETMPNPCQRCEKMGLKCEIDPQFRPKKGSQIQLLKTDVDELKLKIEMLTKNETLLTQALQQHNVNMLMLLPMYSQPPQQPLISLLPPQQQLLAFTEPLPTFNDLIGNNGPLSLHGVLQEGLDNLPATSAALGPLDTPQRSSAPSYPQLLEYVLGEVTLTLDKANELHELFMTKNLPFLPILSLRLANELYHKLQLLFWVVMLTALLLEPEPTLYMLLASLIKQLAIETCWIRTPRLTHVIQLLLILLMWPLPNEKVLDDCSYRFIGLAKNLALQLGLHRGGRFIQEFTRTQVSLGPDADTWRTRLWLAIFFADQFWLLVLGLPPSINTTDYLLENARVDRHLPKDFRCLISLLIFQLKLINVMGVLVTRADGLLEPLNRAALLAILDRELDRLKFKLDITEGLAIEIYHLYIKLMICCFAFLPGTPIEDQVRYVLLAYLLATRIVTLTLKMILTQLLLIELPIYVRQALEYLVLMLFKLHLLRYLIDKFIDLARQLIVTVHRLLRNTLLLWKDLKNDISRNAKVLENLNIVLYTYPEIFLADSDDDNESIITRMRLHLTALLFYDLVWCVHEARRRTVLDKEGKPVPKAKCDRKLAPLPFYNQITKDDFKTLMTTTPNGTTITTLIPTDQAMTQARVNAEGNNKPLEINGIPLAMLEATGLMHDVHNKDTVATPQLPAQLPPAPTPPPVVKTELEWDGGQASGAGQPPQAHFDPSTATATVAAQTTTQGPGTTPLTAPLVLADVNGLPLMEYPGVADQMDNFFQQQLNGWLENSTQEDDFLGWFDLNLLPEKQ